jgi:hypothetical protein
MRIYHAAILLALIVMGACAPMPIPTRLAASATSTLVLVQRGENAIALRTPSAKSTPKSTRTPIAPGSTKTSWSGDLHIHTLCSDGANTYDEMVQQALALHLDFIAITDHVGIAERECHNEAIIKCNAETRLLCFPGAEMSARLHLLAIGIHQRIDPNLPLSGWVQEIHQQGGLAIAAHPYDSRWKYSEDELYRSDLDAMECARGTPEENVLQQNLSVQYNLPCVYNSDAHYKKDVGWRHNVCTVPIESLADLKAALMGGKCRMN